MVFGNEYNQIGMEMFFINTDVQLFLSVSSCVTTYYNRPWNWQAIRDNQQWIIQFASVDDHCISIEEGRYVRDQLQTEYYEFTNRGHFLGRNAGGKAFPELVQALLKKLQPNHSC